jgi:hypothetical protein
VGIVPTVHVPELAPEEVEADTEDDALGVVPERALVVAVEPPWEPDAAAVVEELCEPVLATEPDSLAEFEAGSLIAEPEQATARRGTAAATATGVRTRLTGCFILELLEK